MDNKDLLDPIERTNASRFSLFSVRTFLITILVFVLFLVLAFINVNHPVFDVMVMILALGFIISNIAGVVFTIRSITRQEPDRRYRTVGAIGNILFFFVMLGMVSFVLMDILA